jgi:PAS domain S-box-containing protein
MALKQLIIHLSIYGIIFAFLAALLPWFVFVPVACFLVYLHFLYVYKRKQKRFQAIMQSVRNIQTEAFIDVGSSNGKDIDHVIFDSFKEVAAELEKRCFQLVEKNIQLLSLKEIGLTIISSLDETKVVDSVTTFLAKGLGFKELFVGIFNHENEAMNLYTFRERVGEQTSDKRVVKLPQINGLLKKAIFTHQSLLIRDPGMHQIGNVAGEPLFEDSTMQSFIIVPMTKSASSKDCWKSEECMLREDDLKEPIDLTFNEARCPGCHRFPILGVIGVTDGFKAASLSKVDLVSVETLALQIGTILENTRLYSELEQAEAFRENVINSMMNGLITVDKSGTIVLANETAEKLSGYGSDGLTGMRVDNLLVDGFPEDGKNPVISTLRTGRGNIRREAWLVKEDSSKLPIVLNTTFLLDDSKEVQGVLAVFNDITRIKRMEEKIMHLDKVAALGRFSSSIAHEIRNPLTGIAAGIQYLKRSGTIPDDQQENISFILEEVARIDRLIGDIMNVVREGDILHQSAQIETIIRNCISSLKELADKNTITIKTVFPDKSRKISVDQDKITQVIMNLIKNAIEASKEGNEIIIRVSFPDEVGDVLFDDVRDYAIIEVEDNGIGISEEEKRKIFEPFFSTKHEGTGLGLYVTHSIIERHGGYIFVESDKDRGSTFTVYLPVEKVKHGDANEVSNPSS